QAVRGLVGSSLPRRGRARGLLGIGAGRGSIRSRARIAVLDVRDALDHELRPDVLSGPRRDVCTCRANCTTSRLRTAGSWGTPWGAGGGAPPIRHRQRAGDQRKKADHGDARHGAAERGRSRGRGEVEGQCGRPGGRGRGGDSRELLLLDTLRCPELRPEDQVETSFLRQCLENAMATELTPYERDVLRL
ncbi:hypothetical protein ACHAWF_018636, partial [Thalassiosira exigua]